ncbi:MAG: radical SAM protein [Deltaproteobacteria bacterium]|nr:radical SAM protein [Deltaproteobacteria bacterium]
MINDKWNRAREISWQRFGKKVTFYLPGMFTLNGLHGLYPCLSITGARCALQCDHCRGGLLRSMIDAADPGRLLEACLHLASRGSLGVLISGGCDDQGRLPWDSFFPALEEVKRRTGMYISVHSGLVDQVTASRLKAAGVDQALLDVVGDDETYRSVCHVPFGVSRIASSLEALQMAGLPAVPHIVCGLDHGRMNGERRALEMISCFGVEQVVIVSLMQNAGDRWATAQVRPEDVADLIAEARFRMPHVKLSLGCARQRGNTQMEILALEAGVSRMALPSEEAIRWAEEQGLDISYQRTCCSVSMDRSGEEW